MKYRAVVFDLFHTLVDPEDFRPKEHRRTETVANLIGVDPQAFTSYWQETLNLRTSTSKPVVQYVEEYLSAAGKPYPQDVLTKVDHELGHYQDISILHPRPNVAQVLETLKRRGAKLGILSNCDAREFREWPNSALAPLFDAVCVSYDIGWRKPDLRAYRTTLERLGAQAYAGVFVGDGGDQELEGAKAAGFGRVIFMRGFVSRNGLRTPSELASTQTHADTTVDALEELVSLFDGLKA